MTGKEKGRIYNATVRSLEGNSLGRDELFSRVAARLGFTTEEMANNCADGKKCRTRASLGEIVDGMIGRGLIRDDGGVLSLTESKPVTIRAAACEREVIAMLAKQPLTKSEIRSRLEEHFGTKKTASSRDDNILFSYLGQILKRLVKERTISLENDRYKITGKGSAILGDKESELKLKAEFLDRLHAKGGEFFEHYFLNLLSKYLTLNKKTVTESYVSGGSSDGGIDGVIKTVDALGFRETVMVQTKNRISYTSETEVRGFYGAVCARMGSRGIFATSSDFHTTAAEFLASIDNCVGVNGDMIFDMAKATGFGLKKRGGAYTVDERVI